MSGRVAALFLCEPLSKMPRVSGCVRYAGLPEATPGPEDFKAGQPTQLAYPKIPGTRVGQRDGHPSLQDLWGAAVER